MNDVSNLLWGKPKTKKRMWTQEEDEALFLEVVQSIYQGKVLARRLTKTFNRTQNALEGRISDFRRAMQGHPAPQQVKKIVKKAAAEILENSPKINKTNPVPDELRTIARSLSKIADYMEKQ